MCIRDSPNTVHGIFSSLVKHCLSRYLCERLGKTQQQACLESFKNLPQVIQAPFDQLCELAFIGTKENRVTFSVSDLEGVKHSAMVCDMSLLQVTPSIISDGRLDYFNFLHLSIQELLTAVYITRMPVSKQISIFDSLFGDSRFSAVFQFYAAITKFHTLRPFLSKLPYWLRPVPAGMLDLVRKIIKNQRKVGYTSPRPLLVSLLHCLYEAQDLHLCQFVVEQLEDTLNLNNTSLTLVDCFAISYFISFVPFTTCRVKEFTVDLGSCSLRDAGVKSLMQSICRNVGPHNTVKTHLIINLYSNEIHEEGVSHIAEVLNRTSIVSSLLLDGNLFGDKGLQTIVDSLKQNNTLKHLDVSNCGMTDTGVASLAEVLQTNDTLEALDIGNHAVTENGLTYLVEVLSKSSGLLTLWLPYHLRVKNKVENTINEARKRSGLVAIKVHGK